MKKKSKKISFLKTKKEIFKTPIDAEQCCEMGGIWEPEKNQIHEGCRIKNPRIINKFRRRGIKVNPFVFEYDGSYFIDDGDTIKILNKTPEMLIEKLGDIRELDAYY